MLNLYEYERLVYVVLDEEINDYEYWVFRVDGVSPLPSKHRVKKRYIKDAVSIFKDHPHGIQPMTMDDFNKHHYKKGDNWEPNEALLKHPGDTSDE